ncbi:MAG: tRNA (cytidine(56)-2'-O)-methyltransferase [Candidatus Diapherotrites archaeon]|nr:tRNA (cytidine(56)-2'-O)-methyltransferase [Candidatus Diapherotrites archaeon]
MEAVVLRYGHRMVRDERVTTHCCLVSRALGAKKIILCGEQDQTPIKAVEEVSKRWGAGFQAEMSGSWEKELTEHKKNNFKAVHLTMYGQPIEKKIKQIRKHKKIIVIIGSQKVERKVYELADYNIAVTNQPHSEIAALAIFLHEALKGKKTKFANPELKITPSLRGKNVKKKTRATG